MSPDSPQPGSNLPAGTYDLPVSGESSNCPDAPDEMQGLERRTRPLVIGLAVFSAMMVCILTVALLFYQSSHVETQGTKIIVWGMDPSWDKATVIVTGHNLPPNGLSGVLHEKDHLFLRFHVPPGDYRVVVQKDGKVLARAQTPITQPLTPNTIWWPFRAPPSDPGAATP